MTYINDTKRRTILSRFLSPTPTARGGLYGQSRIRLNTLRWFGHIQRMEENTIPKNVLYINLETTSVRGILRNRWQDEVRKVGKLAGRMGWREKVHNRWEWKKLLRTARNRRILHMSMCGWKNELQYPPIYDSHTNGHFPAAIPTTMVYEFFFSQICGVSSTVG